jgi:hypothetical protein
MIKKIIVVVVMSLVGSTAYAGAGKVAISVSPSGLKQPTISRCRQPLIYLLNSTIKVQPPVSLHRRKEQIKTAYYITLSLPVSLHRRKGGK